MCPATEHASRTRPDRAPADDSRADSPDPGRAGAPPREPLTAWSTPSRTFSLSPGLSPGSSRGTVAGIGGARPGEPPGPGLRARRRPGTPGTGTVAGPPAQRLRLYRPPLAAAGAAGPS